MPTSFDGTPLVIRRHTETPFRLNARLPAYAVSRHIQPSVSCSNLLFVSPSRTPLTNTLERFAVSPCSPAIAPGSSLQAGPTCCKPTIFPNSSRQRLPDARKTSVRNDGTRNEGTATSKLPQRWLRARLRPARAPLFARAGPDRWPGGDRIHM